VQDKDPMNKGKNEHIYRGEERRGDERTEERKVKWDAVVNV